MSRYLSKKPWRGAYQRTRSVIYPWPLLTDVPKPPQADATEPTKETPK